MIKRDGFSLIETLIALALAVMLIPISLSLYSSYRTQTELAQRVRQIDLLWSVLEQDEIFEGEDQALLTGKEERQVSLKHGEHLSGVTVLRRHRRVENGR